MCVDSLVLLHVHLAIATRRADSILFWNAGPLLRAECTLQCPQDAIRQVSTKPEPAGGTYLAARPFAATPGSRRQACPMPTQLELSSLPISYGATRASQWQRCALRAAGAHGACVTGAECRMRDLIKI